MPGIALPSMHVPRETGESFGDQHWTTVNITNPAHRKGSP
jgi:hypothetical protein